MEAHSPERVLTPLEFIQSEVGEPIEAETPLSECGLDSLELLSLQQECQDKFGKRITDADQDDLHTIGDLARFFG